MRVDLIFSSLGDAIGQLFDSAFVRVLLKALAITIIALTLLSFGLAQLAWSFIGDGISLPWIGEVQLFSSLLSGAVMMGLILSSIFLMPPVAVMVVGLFLDEIAEAVETLHYPHMHPVEPMGLGQATADGARFAALFIGLNLVGLLLWPFFFFLGPLLFWVINGILISHEYFMLVAQRRMSREKAKAFLRAHRFTLFLCGVLMAAFLNVPLLNLLIPIFGVASFTHLFHRLPRPDG